MNKWQPIKTAPPNTRVLLGWWDVYDDKQIWRERADVAWKASFFNLIRFKACHSEATHWAPLPEPPKEEI